MNESTQCSVRECIEATFIDSEKGPLFCIESYAEDSCQNLGTVRKGASVPVPRIKEQIEKVCVRKDHLVLFVQPFGEEINLCRRFYSLLRSRLSQAGLVIVQPDLYGTGDSAGSLDEADCDLWQVDLRRVLQYYCNTDIESRRVEKLSIVAMRAGCLMASSLIQYIHQQLETVTLESLVFIQPELNGQDIVTRLFRSRVMAQRLAGNKSQDTRDLWTLIECGHLVHASGHSLSPRLCNSLRQQTIDDVLVTPHGRRRTWFNLNPMPDNREASFTPATTWELIHFSSRPFWQSYDVEPESTLINAVADAILQ